MSLRAFDQRPWLILCEGDSDKRFLDEVIKFRGIPNEFQVRFPDREKERTGGRDKFGPWLNTAQGTSGWEHIRAILVVSDNDQVPKDSFDLVLASLKKAKDCPIPDKERVVTKGNNFPHVVVFMLPTGEPGNLETLCLKAVHNKWPHILEPLNTFAQKVIPAHWHIGKQSKMRLQTIIASTCEARPDSGFLGHWWEDQKFHVPLGHNTFDEIEQFLRNFGSLIARA